MLVCRHLSSLRVLLYSAPPPPFYNFHGRSSTCLAISLNLRLALSLLSKHLYLLAKLPTGLMVSFIATISRILSHYQSISRACTQQSHSLQHENWPCPFSQRSPSLLLGSLLYRRKRLPCVQPSHQCHSWYILLPLCWYSPYLDYLSEGYAVEMNMKEVA